MTRRPLLTVLGGILLTAVSVAQDDRPNRQDDTVSRVRESLERNPRPGTAFDLWVRHLLEESSLEEAVATERERAAETTSVSDDLLFALLLQRAGETAESGAILARATADSESALAAQLYGDWLAGERRFADAVDAYRTALARSPPHADRVSMQLRSGRWSLRLGRTEEALSNWAAMVAEQPDDRLLREELADVLAEEGLRDEARRCWADRRALDADDPSVQYTCGMAIARLHIIDADHDAARSALASLLDLLDGESWQAREVRAQLIDMSLANGDVDELVTLFERRLAKRPDDLAARTALVDALVRVGRLDAAASLLRDAIRLAPTSASLHERLVDVLVEARRWEEVDSACVAWSAADLTALAPHERRGDMMRQRAGSLLTVDDIAEIAKAWSVISDLDSADASAPRRVATLCHDLARHVLDTADGGPFSRRLDVQPLLDETTRGYRLALERGDSRPETRDRFARFLREFGRHEEALAQWRAIAEPPHDSRERIEALLDALVEAGEWKEALVTLDRLLEETPHSTSLLEQWLALRLNVGGRAIGGTWMAKLDALEASAVTEAELERALAARVKAYVQIGQVKEALRVSSRGGVDEASVRDQWWIGLLQMAALRPIRAAVHFRTAHSLVPESALAERLLAEALEASSQFDEAVERYQSVADRDTDLAPHCLDRITHIEEERGHIGAAARSAVARLALEPRNFQAAERAVDLSVRAGDLVGAAEILRRSIQWTPRHAPLRAQFATVLIDLDRPLEALEELWQAVLDEVDEKRRYDVSARLGALALATDRVDPVLDRFRRQATRHPDDAGWSLCLADALLSARQFDAGLSLLADHLARDAENVPLLRHVIDRFDEHGPVEETIRFLSRLQSLDPSPDHLERLARRLSSSRRFDEARQAWGQLLRIDASRSRALLVDVHEQCARGDAALAFDLATLGQAVAPESPEFQQAAVMLALERRDLEALDELLDAWLEPSVAQRSRSLPSTMSLPTVQALARAQPLSPFPTRRTFEEGAPWVVDHVGLLLNVLPLQAVERLSDQTAGQVALTARLTGGQIELEFRSDHGEGWLHLEGASGASISFSILVDERRIHDRVSQLREEQTLQRDQLILLGRSTAGPPFPAVTRGARHQADVTENDPSLIHAMPGDLVTPHADVGAVSWPNHAMFRPARQARFILQRAFSSAPGEPVQQVRLHLLDALPDDAGARRHFALHTQLLLAQREGRIDAWITDLLEPEDPALRTDLAAVLAVHGRFDDAWRALGDAPETSPRWRALAFLHLSSATCRGVVDDVHVDRAIRAMEGWADSARRLHANLSMVSHLVAAGRSEQATEWIRRHVLPGEANAVSLLEFVPWIAAIGDSELTEEALQPLLDAAMDGVMEEAPDGVLWALVRGAPEPLWPRVADLLLEHVRGDAFVGRKDFSPVVTVRIDPTQRRRIRHEVPSPVASLTSRTLTWLSHLHARATAAGSTEFLHSAVEGALAAAAGIEQQTLHCTEIALLWLDGDRDGAWARLELLRQAHPNDPSLDLFAARMRHALGDVVGAHVLLNAPSFDRGSDDTEPIWAASARHHATALLEEWFVRDLLGTPEEVVQGLFVRLARPDALAELLRYLPLADDLERARAAQAAFARNEPVPTSWLNQPTAALGASGCVAAAAEQGELLRLQRALGRLEAMAPDYWAVATLGLLVADAKQDVPAMKRLLSRSSEGDRTRRWFHPSNEPVLLRALAHVELRELAANALVQRFLGFVQDADIEAAGAALTALAERAESDEEGERTAILSAFTTRRPELAEALEAGLTDPSVDTLLTSLEPRLRPRARTLLGLDE